MDTIKYHQFKYKRIPSQWQTFADLTDVTLADEDSNSIPTDDVNRTILGNLAMQVAPPGG